MTEITAFLQSIASIGWLIFLAIGLYQFHAPLSEILGRTRKLRVKLPNGTEIDFSGEEIDSAGKDLLSAIGTLLENMTNEERAVIEHVRNTFEPLTVDQLFPSFRRGTKEHNLLRSLRDREILRPVEGGKGEGAKHVVFKPLGQVLLRSRPKLLLPERNGASQGAHLK